MNGGRATGVVEIMIILAAMVAGAVFVFAAFELGKATRPTEMRVWGSSESTSGSGSSGAGSSSSATNGSGAASNPSTGAGAGAAAGKAAFDKNCTACHPWGDKGVGPALKGDDFKQRYAQDSDVAKVVRDGKGIMPPFAAAAISDSDLTALVSYIKSLSSASSTAPASGGTSAGVSVATGKTAFDKNCVACHPGAKKGVGPDVSGPAFREKFWMDKDLIDLIRTGKNAMPAFKTDKLTEDELLSVIAYLRSVP